MTNSTKKWVALAAAVLVSACESYDGWLRLSLVQLIIEPQEYVGHDVSVSGYARMSRGRLFLFLTEEHARADDIVSAVLLEKTQDGVRMEDVTACHDSFVTVFGHFDELPTEMIGITAVERVIRYLPAGGIDRDCFPEKEQ